MTVAAVVLAPPLGEAKRPVGGVASIRRIADIAWAGGAFPIVIVPEEEAASLEIEEPLAGAPGTVIATGPVDAIDPLGRIAGAIATAREEVEATDAVLVWPGRHVHVDAETVTSLIEAHGADPAAILVASYRGTPGWPLLLPLGAADLLNGFRGTPLAGLAEAIEKAGARLRSIELGDPGIVHDSAMEPQDLPAFEGPPEPVGAVTPDWGERIPEADPSPAPPRSKR